LIVKKSQRKLAFFMANRIQGGFFWLIKAFISAHTYSHAAEFVA